MQVCIPGSEQKGQKNLNTINSTFYFHFISIQNNTDLLSLTNIDTFRWESFIHFSQIFLSIKPVYAGLDPDPVLFAWIWILIPVMW